jgi:cell division protein FtsA
VLTDEEKELGVALVDLGGGTTDVLVYSDGAPYSTTTIPAGGTQVTSDISIMKSIAFDTAEKIKMESGSCWEGASTGDEEIIVPGVGGRPPLPIPRFEIEEIIRPRMSELFTMVKEKLDKLSLARPLGGGVVLTGGGSMLLGAAELAQDVFGMPARVGSPLLTGGLVDEYRSPEYATAVGLVLEGFDREGGAEKAGDGGGASAGKREVPLIGKLADWLKKEFF